MIYIYQRVSTTKQSEARQEYVLEKQGIKADKVFTEKVTGKHADRPKLQELMLKVQKGDIVYAESISRMARNLKDAIEIMEYFIDRGVRVMILKEGIDTTTSTYKLLLGIFGAIAEMERETIQERVTQRIDQLKEVKETTGKVETKSGKWFGREERKVSDLTKDFKKYYDK